MQSSQIPLYIFDAVWILLRHILVIVSSVLSDALFYILNVIAMNIKSIMDNVLELSIMLQ